MNPSLMVLPYLIFEVGKLLYLLSTETVSVWPNVHRLM